MSITVKICGITDEAAYAAAAEAGADYIGFVFFPPSPRAIGPQRAAILAARHEGGPARVGLFVDPTPHEIGVVLAALPLDALQLYAEAAQVAALRARFGLPCWQALGVARPTDLPLSAEGIDRLVIEAKPPEGAGRPGGNATPIDWRLTRRWRAPVPWMLAGGLDPGNVAAAIATSGATGVDVSSGVESAPGRKDPALIRAFIAAARAATPSPAGGTTTAE